MTSAVRGIFIASVIVACSKRQAEDAPDGAAKAPSDAAIAASTSASTPVPSTHTESPPPPSAKPETSAAANLCRPTKSPHNANTSGRCMWTVILEGDLKTCTWEKDRRGSPEQCKRLCGHDEDHCVSMTANIVSCGVCKGRDGGAQ